MMIPDTIKIISFDADDTLWINMTYFQEAENNFYELLKDYGSGEEISGLLFNTEMHNLPVYGYGIKSFVLSMIESAIEISNGKINSSTIGEIISLGKKILYKPVRLLEGVKEVLEKLHGRYKLVLATKGDLLDQENKLKKSGLECFFHHIEIMSDKQVNDYKKLFLHLDCKPSEFLMIGNSIVSDIMPVLETGAYAALVPFHITWAYEQGNPEIKHPNFILLNSISDILCDKI